jgi:hypothetical protein
VKVAEGLARAHARGRSGEWKLAGGGGKGKGSPGGSYRGRCGAGGEWDMTSMLGVGWLGARISRARWGKMLQVKWSWLRAPFIASGRRGKGLEEATNRRRWKFNTGRF